MEAVADTSFIVRLMRGEAISCLSGLFKRVWLPPAVRDECHRPATQTAINDPVFVVRSVQQLRFTDLGAGEREAINLALDLGVTTLLTDDEKAFRRGHRLGLKPIRVFDLLIIAKAQQLIPSVRAVLDRMRENGEGLRRDLYQSTLAKAGEAGDDHNENV